MLIGYLLTRPADDLPAPAWCMGRLVGSEKLGRVVKVASFPDPGMLVVPFKLNQTRRCHIPRTPRRVTNWPAYDASLRQPAPARQLDGVVY